MRKKKKKLIIIGIVSILLVVLLAVGMYFNGLTSVSKTSEIVEFTVKSGSGTREVINNLYDANIIKNKLVTLIYTKINGNINIKAGKYELDRSYDTKKILDILSDGANSKGDTIRVTFVEGKRIVDYAKVISEKFGYTEEEVINTISDKEYLKSLIEKYDFLTDEILNSDIYYPLEGYLYPATYDFYKDSSIKAVIEKMLDKTKNVLDNYSAALNSSSYSVHQILTMASIIESETRFKEDRAPVSQVIYKRLDMKMSLGMDVTTYYGARKSMSETLTRSDLNAKNAYNTRNTEFIGLPVGPICNPRMESIEAALNPSNTNYIYFYADVYGKDGKDYIGKLHFAENYSEFQSLIRKYS